MLTNGNYELCQRKSQPYRFIDKGHDKNAKVEVGTVQCDCLWETEGGITEKADSEV